MFFYLCQKNPIRKSNFQKMKRFASAGGGTLTYSIIKGILLRMPNVFVRPVEGAWGAEIFLYV